MRVAGRAESDADDAAGGATAADSPRTTIWRGTTGRRRWMAAVLCVVVVGVLTGGFTAYPLLHDRVDVADRFGSHVGVGSGADSYDTTIRVPSGTIQVTVSRPSDRAHRYGSASGQGDLRAPWGGRFVEVRWSSSLTEPKLPGTYLDLPPTTKDNAPAVLRLRTGGEGYAIATLRPGAADSSEGSVVIAVDGDGSDLSIATSYVGRTQTVDMVTGEREPGAADALYPPWTPTGAGRCVEPGPPSDSTMSWQAECSYPTLVRAPYVAGLGWAPKGRIWVVTTSAHVSVTEFPRWKPSEDSDAFADYFAADRKPRATVRVNGDLPVRTLQSDRTESGHWTGGIRVFQIADDATVKVSMNVAFTFPFDYASPGLTGYPKRAVVTVQR